MGRSRIKFTKSLKCDNVTDMEMTFSEAGIFHKTNRRYHAFNREYIENILDYCLDQTQFLDIFTNNKVGKRYQENKILVETWNTKSKYGMYASDDNSYEYLVFRCPCKFNNSKVGCEHPINAEKFLDTYIDKQKDEKVYNRLHKKIQTKKLMILDTVYQRIIYCQNSKCESSEGTILQSCKEELIKTNQNMVTCTNCDEFWCLKCNKTFEHEAKYCDQISEIKKNMDELLENKEHEQIKFYLETSVPCTNCNHWISKSYDCDHMTCSRCRHQFCWICLKNMDRIRFSQHIGTDNDENEYMCVNIKNYQKRKEIIKNNRIKLFKEVLGEKYEPFYKDLKFKDNYVTLT